MIGNITPYIMTYEYLSLAMFTIMNKYGFLFFQALQQNNREVSDLSITQEHCSRTVKLGEDSGATLQLHPNHQSDQPTAQPGNVDDDLDGIDRPNQLESFHQAGWQLGGRVSLAHHRQKLDHVNIILLKHTLEI